MVMNERTATQLVRAYAAQWSVPVRGVRLLGKKRAWCYFCVSDYVFEVDTGDGTALATVSEGSIYFFDYKPTDAKTFLLPLWAAHPGVPSFTMRWGVYPGEEYKYRWHGWYRSLDDAERSAYKQRFPAPTDEELGWAGFYERVADVPATGKNPIGEYMMGRV
jgi:hypothetical protein